MQDVAIIKRYKGRIILGAPSLSPAHGRVIHDQTAYDQFVAMLPKLKIQMKQPSPPNDDPLLKKPAIDFSSQMLVVALRHRMYYGPKIEGVLLDKGKALVVKIVHESPKGIMAMASRNDVGSYEAVLIARASEAPDFQLRKVTTAEK